MSADTYVNIVQDPPGTPLTTEIDGRECVQYVVRFPNGVQLIVPQPDGTTTDNDDWHGWSRTRAWLVPNDGTTPPAPVASADRAIRAIETDSLAQQYDALQLSNVPFGRATRVGVCPHIIDKRATKILWSLQANVRYGFHVVVGCSACRHQGVLDDFATRYAEPPLDFVRWANEQQVGLYGV